MKKEYNPYVTSSDRGKRYKAERDIREYNLKRRIVWIVRIVAMKSVTYRHKLVSKSLFATG